MVINMYLCGVFFYYSDYDELFRSDIGRSGVQPVEMG